MTQPAEKLLALLAREELNADTVHQINQLITSKELSILQLIESLQSDLLDALAERRVRAVSLIAKVLELLIPAGAVSDKEIELLAEFFCSKLKDHHSLLPATLHGLFALSSSSGLPQGQAKLIAQAIFQDVHCQSQLQSDRRRIYSTLKNLLTSRLEELQVLGSGFVFGFIQAVDQERDPRNLLIIFSIVPIVSKYFKLEPFTEELFEVFSCYFPIDFTAQADDPFGITKEQLGEALRQCLASNAQFAEYCLPLLLEKLDSDVLSAKIDALNALELCCQSYEPAQLDRWVEEFWTSIRREILVNVNSDALDHAALDALTAIARCVTSQDGQQILSAHFGKILQDILTECLGHLSEPERRLMTPSSYILLAISAGSSPACRFIMSQVIPLLLDQYQRRTQSTPRQFILNTLNKMVHAGLYGYTELEVGKSGVHPFMPTLIDLYLEILQVGDSTLHQLSLQGLAHFTSVIHLSQSAKIFDTLLDVLARSESVSDGLVDEIANLFRQSAEQNLDWAVQHLLPRLLDMVDSAHNQAVFRVLSSLPPLPLIRSHLVPKLMAMVEREGSVHPGLLQVLTSFSRNGGPEMFRRLHDWVLNTKEQQQPPVLPATCAILRSLSSSLTPEEGIQVLQVEGEQYVDRHLSAAPWTVMVMEAAIGSLDVVPDGPVAKKLIRALEPLALLNNEEDIRLSSCRLIAALINKLTEGPALEELLDSFYRRKPDEMKNSQVVLFIWITKALVMRSYSKVKESIQQLVESLSDPTHGYFVAEGFKTILSDTEQCLNTNSHANIKLMYRQRFFQEVVPRLLDLYQSSGKDSSGKAPVFAAIANQLAFIPQGVLLAHIKTLVPLLVQCLAVDQPDRLITSTLEALLALMADNNTAMVDYIDTLVSRLLVLAKDGQSMHVRRLALKGLSELRNAPQIVLLPLRSQVIAQLVPCLGDRKRLVRREAALARQRWIMLGQPGGH